MTAPGVHRRRPRRRVLVDVAGVAIAAVCYLLLATRGAAVGWVLP